MRGRTVKPKPLRIPATPKSLRAKSVSIPFNSIAAHSQSVQRGDETDDDDIEADNETVQSNVDADNKRTESRDEDHNGGKDFSDGLFEGKKLQ